MYRPPKPPSKVNKPFPSLQIVSSNMSRHQALENPIKMRVHRPNSQDSKKDNISSTKKSEQSQPSVKNHCTTAFVTPKSLHDKSKQKKQVASIQSSIFKIRNISIHIKKPKQNMQPNNMQNIQIEGPKNYRSQHNKKKSTFFLQDTKPIQFQQHYLEAHPLEDQLNLIHSKTGVVKLNKQPFQSKICFVLSQCVFQQSMEYQSTIFQLKAICDSIFYSTHATIVLKLHSDIDMEAFQNNIKGMHIHHLHYVVWNEQKFIQNINVFELPSMPNIQNYVIISSLNNGIIDVYHANNNKSDTHRTKDGTIVSLFRRTPNYLYLQLMEIEKLIKFVTTLKIQKQNKKQQVYITHQHEHIQLTNQCYDHSTIMRDYNPYKVVFDKNSMIINSTRKFLQIPKIAQKINFMQIKTKKQSTLVINKQRTKSSNDIQKQPSTSQFCQQYKKKMIQLAKIIYTESNETKIPNNQIVNINQNNFMKLKVPEQVANVMGMGCVISANTAYQFVGELLRVNSVNYKHITQWRNKTSL